MENMLKTAAIALVAVAIASRIPAVAKLLYGEA